MSSITNYDEKRRDEIIFGKYDPSAYLGGLRHFDGMTRETLHRLIDEGFVDVDTTQNDSPSIQDFLDFMDMHDGYVVGGYVVSARRSDYRVSVDAITKTTKITEADDLKTFVEFARLADEFNSDGFAWWD